MTAHPKHATEAPDESLPAHLLESLGDRIDRQFDEYEGNKLWLVLGIGGIGAAAISVFIGVISLSLIWTAEDMGTAGGICLFVGFCFIGAILGGLGYWGYRRYRNSQGTVGLEVFENGLVKHWDGETTASTWEEFAEMHRSLDQVQLGGLVDMSVPWSFVLEDEDGQKWNLKVLPGGRNHADFIYDRVFEVMFEEARSTIEAGGTAEFGAHGVSSEGLHGFRWGEVVPWEEVDGLTVKGKMSRITVVTNSTFESAMGGIQGEPWMSVPNGSVLFALCEHYTRPVDSPRSGGARSGTP